MPNDESTAGPAGAAKAIAKSKAVLAETHKHFGDNPDYAPPKPPKNDYAIPHAARQASKPPTTMEERDTREANVDNYLTNNPGGPIK